MNKSLKGDMEKVNTSQKVYGYFVRFLSDEKAHLILIVFLDTLFYSIAHMTISLVGYIAAFCTTIAFLPQSIKTLKTKQTKDISLPMYTIFTAGVFLWTIYGIAIQNVSVALANFISFFFVVPILLLKLKRG